MRNERIPRTIHEKVDMVFVKPRSKVQCKSRKIAKIKELFAFRLSTGEDEVSKKAHVAIESG